MSQKVHPGESFSVSAVIVGWDFGATTGIVYANYLPILVNPIKLDSSSYVISDSKQCTKLTFSLFSRQTKENVTMYIIWILK